MNTTPINYRFALFGLRRSGKSVFLAALNADRRPISDGSTISYVDTEPPYFPGLSEDDADLRRQRAKGQFLENARGLGLGRVPAETETTEGVTTHCFNLTLADPPASGASQIIRIELLDYAGELLKPHSEETDIRDLLHRALSETDGLVILAETPPSAPQSAGGVMAMQPLSELASALNTLHDQDPQALRCATLLVTKWDRRHPFDIVRNPDESERDFREREKIEEIRHRDLFDDWLEDAAEAGRLRELDRQLRASFAGADYSVWPTSAFGVSELVQVESSDGLPVEINARPELASLNLVEPLRFLIDRTKEQHRRALEALAPDGTTASADLPTDEAIVAEHGKDEVLRAHALALRDASATAEAAAKVVAARSRVRAIRNKVARVLAGAIPVCLLIGGVMYAKQAVNVSELRNSFDAAWQSDNLELVIEAHDQILANAGDRPIFGSNLPAPDREKFRLELAARECKLWERRAGQGALDIALARSRQAILPQCVELDNVLAKETERAWRADVVKAQDNLSAVAFERNCKSPRFNTSALNQASDVLMELLGKPPATVDLNESAYQRDTAEQQRAVCMAWWTDALAMEAEHVWRADVDKADDNLSAVASEANCRDPRFNTAVLDDAYVVLREILGKTPTTVDPSEVASRRGKADQQRADCMTSWSEARLKSDHEGVKGRLLEQQEWLKFFEKQAEFLKNAQDTDKSKSIDLVQVALGELAEKIGKWTDDRFSKPADSLAEMKNLQIASDKLKGSVANELGGQLDMLRKTVGLAIEKLEHAAMCEAVDPVAGGYVKMLDDLSARNPSAVDKLRKAVDGLKQHERAIPLVREVENNLKNGVATIYLKRVVVQGNVPFDFRSNEEVRGLLKINAGKEISLDWRDATKQTGFGLSMPVSSWSWPEGDTNVQIHLEQDKLWGKNYFSGQREVSHADLFSAMTGSGRSVYTELKISIARDENAKNLHNVQTGSGSANDIVVRFFLNSDPLPDLKENPCPAN